MLPINKANFSVGSVALLFALGLLIFMLFNHKEKEPNRITVYIARAIATSVTFIVVLWILGII